MDVIKGSKLTLKRFSHTNKTFNGFIAESHKRFSGKYLQKTDEQTIVVSIGNLQHLNLRPCLNIFIERWYNNETLLSLISLLIDKDKLFIGPQTINFEQTCISDLIFVGP